MPDSMLAEAHGDVAHAKPWELPPTGVGHRGHPACAREAIRLLRPPRSASKTTWKVGGDGMRPLGLEGGSPLLSVFLFTGLTVLGIIIAMALMIRALHPADDDATGPLVAIISGGSLAGVGILALTVGLLELFVDAGGTLAGGLIGLPVAVAVVAAVEITRLPRRQGVDGVPQASQGTSNAARSAVVLLVLAIAGLSVLTLTASLLCLLLDDPTASGLVLLPVIAAAITVSVSIAAGWVVLRTSRARSRWRAPGPQVPSGDDPRWTTALVGALLLTMIDAITVLAVMLVPLGIV
jgi:hypothetical protein